MEGREGEGRESASANLVGAHDRIANTNATQRTRATVTYCDTRSIPSSRWGRQSDAKSESLPPAGDGNPMRSRNA